MFLYTYRIQYIYGYSNTQRTWYFVRISECLIFGSFSKLKNYTTNIWKHLFILPKILLEVYINKILFSRLNWQLVLIFIVFPNNWHSICLEISKTSGRPEFWVTCHFSQKIPLAHLQRHHHHQLTCHH